jgi:tyrosyl-tRNA synthetase
VHKLIQELKDRGMFNNITNLNKVKNIKKGDGVYIGFDPTANSLHLGNYVQIKILNIFKKHGLKPYAVLGGATGMIGDPSGRSSERTLQSQEDFSNNKELIKKQLLSFGFSVVDNYDFYKDMNIITFLQEVGKLLNINYMMNKEVVKSRIESGISFTEFSYQLIQG